MWPTGIYGGGQGDTRSVKQLVYMYVSSEIQVADLDSLSRTHYSSTGLVDSTAQEQFQLGLWIV